MADGPGCGPMYTIYVAARANDHAALRTAWEHVDYEAIETDETVIDDLDDAISAGDADSATALLAEHVFAEEPDDRIDGPLATLLGTFLWAFGYVAAFVLFFRAYSPEAVVSRLRWAYGVVGVNVQDTETVDGVERTTFRCPYRNVGADRWGQRRVCHDVLDRVDDGYVTFLDRHRDLEYDRPRPCAGGPCCYSEVTDE